MFKGLLILEFNLDEHIWIIAIFIAVLCKETTPHNKNVNLEWAIENRDEKYCSQHFAIEKDDKGQRYWHSSLSQFTWYVNSLWKYLTLNGKSIK